MKFGIAFVALIIAVVFWAVVPASAGVNYSSGACVEFADTLEPITWISVGCETVDCCPGCPGNTINWRIRVSGDALESVVFQFDNLPAGATRSLKIKGRAHWEGNTLRVGPGETIVSGFKYDPRALPAVATPRLFGNKRILSRLRDEVAQNVAASNDRGRMEVVVEQLMGKNVINEARVFYKMVKCPSFGNTDHVALQNNVGNDNAVVLFDARDRFGNCLDDSFRRGTATVFMGDLHQNGFCNSEVMIFSDDNAMALVRPTFWTDSVFDNLPVTLQPIRVAPIAVWLVDSSSDTQLRAQFGMAAANYFYNFHNVGIAFSPTYTDISSNTSAVNLLDGQCVTDQIKASSFYRPNQLNVYYIDNPGLGDRGVNCFGGEPNIIFINKTAVQETLAHELGHAFSLDHPNYPPATIDGFAANNIMWSGATGRTNFTIGQAVRMNLNVNSVLNVNKIRIGLVRDPPCGDRTVNELCPALIADSTPQ